MSDAKRIEPAGRWPDDVTVWRIDCAPALAHGLDREALRHLDEAEREHAQRFRRLEDRVRFVLARAALRELLAERLGAPPRALRFGASAHGRPVLAAPAGAPAFAFNVSHSGAHALLALSSAREVGIDVELLTQGADWCALSAVACTQAERATLACLPDASRARAFVRIWTAKEAVLKAVGVGIAEDLQSFSIDPREDGGAATVPGAHADALRFHWLDELPGATACVAWSSAWRQTVSDTAAD